MVSNEYKIISLEDGSEYRFDTDAFKEKVQEYVIGMRKKGLSITKAAIIVKLSEVTNVSPSAVSNWLYGKNGTGELETVKLLAKELGVNYIELLRKVENRDFVESEDKEMSSVVEAREMMAYDFWNNYVIEDLTLEEGVATKRAIRECVQYIVECIHNYIDSGDYDYGWDTDAQKCASKFDNLFMILHRNMLDLPYDLYVVLEKFIEEDMKPIVYYYKNMEPDEFNEYSYNEAMAEASDQVIRGISIEQMIWEHKESLKNECKPLFDKLHEIIKPYI